MEKKTSRQLQAEKTKANIRDAAFELLKKKTLDDLSVNEICKAANVSVGAFYHHFLNKSGIVIELYKEIDVQFIEEVYPAMLKEEPIEAIYRYLQEQCAIPPVRGLDLTKNIYKAQIDYGNEFFLSEGRGLAHGLYLLILRAQEQGLVTDQYSGQEIANELLTLSRGVIYNWCVSGGKTDLVGKVRWMAEHYLQSFML